MPEFKSFCVKLKLIFFLWNLILGNLLLNFRFHCKMSFLIYCFCRFIFRFFLFVKLNFRIAFDCLDFLYYIFKDDTFLFNNTILLDWFRIDFFNNFSILLLLILVFNLLLMIKYIGEIWGGNNVVLIIIWYIMHNYCVAWLC